ncbi:hypothetical protein BGZ60DRAFT_428600 [Tricladium varicosporioides]|nr:hypothetical protein BGZ60DRAFT_428600 [Hymenoscyphus varicosporioides]
MAQADRYIFLVQQRLYEDSIDQKGRLSVLGCYNSIPLANAAAKAAVRSLYEGVNPDSTEERYGNYDGLLFDSTVFMGAPDTDRVEVFVEKILCACYSDSIINGNDYITLNDEVEEVEDDDERGETENLEDDTLPTTLHFSLLSSKGFLAGLTFAFAGSLTRLSREEAETLVYRCGGYVVVQLTQETSYVVLGADPTRTQLKKIQELGIKTLSEKDLRYMAMGIAKSTERNGIQDGEVDDLAVVFSTSTSQRSSVAATVGTDNLDDTLPSMVRKAVNGNNVVSSCGGTEGIVFSPSVPLQPSTAATVGTAEPDLDASSTIRNVTSALIPTCLQENLDRKRSREDGTEGEDSGRVKPSPKRQKGLYSPGTKIMTRNFEYTRSSMRAQDGQQLSEQGIAVKYIEERKLPWKEPKERLVPETERAA